MIFQAEDKAQGVQVFYENETIWATQEAIATLFDKGRTTITEHLRHIFESGELEQQSVCRKFRHTTADGKNYDTQFYKLDAIISVGYCVNSIRATQFRRVRPWSFTPRGIGKGQGEGNLKISALCAWF